MKIFAYGSFFVENHVTGGYNYEEDYTKIEKCTLSGATMSCEQQEPELVLLDYYGYPELFLVPEDYCKNQLVIFY